MNPTFEQTMIPLLRKAPKFIHIEQLREIALLMHKIGYAKIGQILWIVYLRSDTGQMKILRQSEQAEQQQQQQQQQDIDYLYGWKRSNLK